MTANFVPTGLGRFFIFYFEILRFFFDQKNDFFLNGFGLTDLAGLPISPFPIRQARKKPALDFFVFLANINGGSTENKTTELL